MGQEDTCPAVLQFVEPELVSATVDTWNLAKVPKTAPKS